MLHLSDLHVGQGDAAERDTQLLIRQAITRDAKKVVQSLGQRPDMIFFTGDIVFSGASAQYKEAKAFLDDLCSELGVPPSRVFLVPGNHDIDRKIAERNETLHEGYRAKPDKGIAKLLGSDYLSEATAIFEKFAAFAAFAHGFGGPAITSTEPFWKAEFQTPLGPVAVIGLNSAMLSYNDGDSRENLILGTRQRMLLNDSNSSVLRVVLVHHAPHWLLDGDQLKNDLGTHPHLLFYGHVHKQGGGVTFPIGFGSTLELVGGACQVPMTELLQEAHAYTWYRITRKGLDVFQRVMLPKQSQFWARQLSPDAEGLTHDQHLRDYIHIPLEKLPNKLKNWINGNSPSSCESLIGAELAEEASNQTPR